MKEEKCHQEAAKVSVCGRVLFAHKSSHFMIDMLKDDMLPWRRRNTKCHSFIHSLTHSRVETLSTLCPPAPAELLHIAPPLSFLFFFHLVLQSVTLRFTLYSSCHNSRFLFDGHLAVLADHLPLSLDYSPSYTQSTATTGSLPPLLPVFHRFNRMHLGHTSILCSSDHLGAKLRSNYRPGK